MVYLIIEFMHVASDTSPTLPNVKAIGQLIMEILWHFINGGGGGNVASHVTQLILWNFNGSLAPGGGGGGRG